MRRSRCFDSHGSATVRAILLPVAIFFLPGSAHAQSLDAPDTVCTGDEFEVVWTGPDGPGDSISIAEPTSSAGASLDSWQTQDGSPATLTAPTREGFYDVRYVQANPESILVREGLTVVSCLASGTGTGETGTPSDDERLPASALPTPVNHAVLVTGVQTNYGDIVHQQTPFGEFDGTIEALCGASDTIGMAMNAIVGKFEQSMTEVGSPITFDMVEQLPGAPTRAGMADGLRTVRDEVCDLEEKPPQVQPFAITYAYCRMAMVTPYQVMDIHLPPQAGTGTMSVADYTEGEAIQVTLSRSFDASAEVLGPGWSSQVAMTSPTDGGTRIGYPTTRYNFSYSGGLGGGGMVPFAEMVSTESSGTVWVSQAVPGLDIVRSFYDNLTREVSSDLADNSFFAGLLKNLVGMLRNGLPLEIEQSIESRVMGSTSVSGRSHSIITDVRLVRFRPEWCSESLLPSNMPVRDIDQEIANAMGQSGASSSEMQDAMRQYNEAMQQMTPEQKQAMEQFGMGDMMQQMMGGANPGGNQAASGAAAGAGTAGAAESKSGGSSIPPAEELNSGNLTESVEKHLQALGYDVGDVDGEASMETTIAISTFQAEKGMEVTGEVSPQLLGVLSAEVDSRR